MILVISLITSCFVCFLLTCVPTGVSLLSSSPVWCHLHTCLTSSWWSLPVSPPAPPPPTLSFSYCVFLLALCRFFCFAPVFPARLTCPPVHLSTCPPLLSSSHHLGLFTHTWWFLSCCISFSCLLSLSSWLNKLNKQTDLKERHKYCFTLFICGGPCHLSSFTQCSGTFVSSENSSLYYYLINIVKTKLRVWISSLKLHTASFLKLTSVF